MESIAEKEKSFSFVKIDFVMFRVCLFFHSKFLFWAQEEENELEETEENEESTDVKFLQVPNQRLKFNLTGGSPFCIGRRGSCSTIEFLSQMNSEMKQQHLDTHVVRNQPNIQVSSTI